MTYIPYVGVKQAKILGICKSYGNINTEIITKLYKGNRCQAVKSVKALEKKGFLVRIGYGIFTLNPKKKIDWQEIDNIGVKKEEDEDDL